MGPVMRDARFVSYLSTVEKRKRCMLFHEQVGNLCDEMEDGLKPTEVYRNTVFLSSYSFVHGKYFVQA